MINTLLKLVIYFKYVISPGIPNLGILWRDSSHPFQIGQEMAELYMKFERYRNHFTDNLAKKGKKIELGICKLAK